jgi:hypothetical protein
MHSRAGGVSWTQWSNYYVGGSNAVLWTNIEVEADASWNNGVIQSVTFYVWQNGVLQNHNIPVTLMGQYQDTPIAYQNTLVAAPGASPVTCVGGTGYFYTFGNPQYKTPENGVCQNAGTQENSNMAYFAFLEVDAPIVTKT